MNKLFFTVSLMTVALVGNELDYSFGINGMVKSGCNNTDNAYSFIKSVLVQPDDKVITVGTEWRGDDKDGYRIIALYRYLPDGTKDVTFGKDGAVYADHICTDYDTCGKVFYQGGEDVRNAILQPDGKIVVQTDAIYSLARFNADGSLDTQFGAHGGFAWGGDVGYGHSNWMTMQKDGKILIIGQNRDAEHNSAVAVVRYTSNGFVDTSFGTSGTVTTNLTNSDEGYGVAVQPDGKIVVAGNTYGTINGCGEDRYMRGLLLRYKPDGTLDPSFDGDGIMPFSVSTIFDAVPTESGGSNPCQGSYMKRVSILPDGKILTMGTGFNSSISFFLARFNQNSTIDTSFGYQGARAMYDSYDYDQYKQSETVFHYHVMHYTAANMKVLENGKIILNGKQYGGSYNGSSDRFLAVRFASNGSFDHTFGSYGRTIINPDPDDYLYYGTDSLDVAEQSTGKLLMGGWVGGTTDTCKFYGTLMRLEKDRVSNSSIIMYLLD
jgi:uncharacterized delta-60 repeat protein